MLILLISCQSAFADIRLPRLISDGMVLQRDKKLKIWGWADENESIRVTFNKKNYTTRALADRLWEIELPSTSAGGPFVMTIKGNNEVIIKDILIGEVWICSGQSNMELPIKRVAVAYPDLAKSSINPHIRHFGVVPDYLFNGPGEDFKTGTWQEANPSNLMEFSAVGYFFAKELYDRYKVPIGLIRIAVGGTPIEAWQSEDVTARYPKSQNLLTKYKDHRIVDSLENAFRQKVNTWSASLDHNDAGLKEEIKWYSNDYQFSDWKTFKVPALWWQSNNPFLRSLNIRGQESKFENTAGIIWFKKEINLSKSQLNGDALLLLGTIIERDETYFNGHKIGETSYQYPPRRYAVPREYIEEGKNIITVRIGAVKENAGFIKDKLYALVTNGDTLSLSGDWKYKVGHATQNGPSGQITFRNQPSGLFNAMVAPTLNYANRGVIWYQGESNAGNSTEYGKLFHDLITDWREKYRNSTMPFLFVQLSNYMESKPIPVESNWAVIRDSQRKTLQLVQTGMAVTIDIGEANDIHPLNKRDVGYRLSLLARNKVYKETQTNPYGPLYKNYKVVGHKIVLYFYPSKRPMLVRGGGVLKGFAIAGEDKKFVWANAEIFGKTIVVSCPSVVEPKFVRYAWADNPDQANLVDSDNLPASPFSTTF